MPGGAEEDPGKIPSGQTVSGPRFKSRTFKIRSKCATHPTVTFGKCVINIITFNPQFDYEFYTIPDFQINVVRNILYTRLSNNVIAWTRMFSETRKPKLFYGTYVIGKPRLIPFIIQKTFLLFKFYGLKIRHHNLLLEY